MADDAFLATLKRITGEALGLGDVINAATGLSEGGKPDLAIQLYKVWIGVNADSPQRFIAWFNCACLETQVNDLAAATESLKQVIGLNPDFMPAYINLGGLVEKSGAPDNGVELWRAGLARLPQVTGSSIDSKLALLKQIARVKADQHRMDEAEAVLRECLDINPRQRDVIEQFVAMRLGQCHWPVLDPLPTLDARTMLGEMHPLSVAAYTDDPLLQLAAAARCVAQTDGALEVDMDVDRRHAAIDLTARRLRIGYVSSDLREHAVGFLMSELFELHDRTQVEVFAYYCGIPSSDAINTRIRAAVERWVDISQMSDAQAARQIAADGIDILVDVNGHTRFARTGVFARRPAPVLVNWLGYPGTMGSPYHHYIVADPVIIPPGSERFYSETVARVPCYQANDRKRIIATQPTRADAGLPDDAVVFCCFNGSQKISRHTFDRWVDILRQTPDSVLWLLSTAEDVDARLRDRAEAHGVAPDRIIFAPKLQNAHHLARYPLADLFLDTSPYGAHTTASDALWMGVPVLTLAGRSFASRVCASLVSAAGLPDLVTERPGDYVDRAVELGRDRAAIAALKARLESGRGDCDLFNMEQLAARLEALYLQMATAHAAGATPTPDLDNLDAYLEAGVRHDHEGREMACEADYDGLYRTALAKRHRLRPLRPTRGFGRRTT